MVTALIVAHLIVLAGLLWHLLGPSIRRAVTATGRTVRTAAGRATTRRTHTHRHTTRGTIR